MEAIAGSKLTIEDDNLYQLAIALADNYRCGNWKEFCELSKKIRRVARNDTFLYYLCR